MTGNKYDLKKILSPEEREFLGQMLSMSPEATKALVKVVRQFVADRGQAVLVETDPARVMQRKSEYDGAAKLARELETFFSSKSHVVE